MIASSTTLHSSVNVDTCTQSTSTSPLHIAGSLIRVGNELFSRGFEHDAMSMFDAAHAALRTPAFASEASELTYKKNLNKGTEVLLSNDCAPSDEESFNLPDLYQEDECDVGPRVLRTPLRPERTALSAHATFLEAAVCFNKALIFHDNLDFAEAKALYQSVLQALQALLVVVEANEDPTGSTNLLEVATRAHNNMGQLSYLAGEEETAKGHFEAAIMCAKQVSELSKDHRLTYATVLSNWCRACWMRGDITDSLYSGLREVLRIRTALLAPSHVDVAASHYNVAVAEYARHQNEKAVSHLIQYLNVASQRAESNMDDLDSIPALIYLLLIQNEDKEDSMSQELVRGLRTLQDKRQDQGQDSPEVASVLNFIGTILFHKEDFPNALLFFQEELRLEECVTDSKEDISVSVTCNNIGRILQELGKLNEAVVYYQRALQPAYGDISQTRGSKGMSVCKPDRAECNPSSSNLYSTVWYNLGLIHDKLGSYADAISAFEMSLELRRSMLGNDHPDIACLLYNIGVLQMEQQLLKDASKSFREALRIRRAGAAGQLNDKHVVKTLEKLSSLHKAKGNINGALDASREVLRIQEVSADYDNMTRMRETGTTLRSMAELNHATGDVDIALRLSKESVRRLRLVCESDCSNPLIDPVDKVAMIEQLVSSLLLVGSLYHEMCEPIRASALLQEASLTIRSARRLTNFTGSSASLDALMEVTAMLATTHCAAEA